MAATFGQFQAIFRFSGVLSLTVQPSNCPTVPPSNCPTVQLFKCITDQLFDFSTVLMSNFLTVNLSDCQTVQISNCPTKQLSFIPTVQPARQWVLLSACSRLYKEAPAGGAPPSSVIRELSRGCYKQFKSGKWGNAQTRLLGQ